MNVLHRWNAIEISLVMVLADDNFRNTDCKSNLYSAAERLHFRYPYLPLCLSLSHLYDSLFR